MAARERLFRPEKRGSIVCEECMHNHTYSEWSVFLMNNPLIHTTKQVFSKYVLTETHIENEEGTMIRSSVLP